MQETSTHVFAPAKVNLYLHVTGKRGDGYHTLDSLMGFVDVGDEITITPNEQLSFQIEGPYASAFDDKECDISPASKNLVMQAAWGISKLTGHRLDCSITLRKNLPLGAGIGGGSADAAAVIWGLLELWDLPADIKGLDELLLSLGADVPVCFGCETQRVQGIGEVFSAPPMIPEMPILLVYPGIPSHTKSVFKRYTGEYSDAIDALPDMFEDVNEVCAFLKDHTRNDLTAAAQSDMPIIQNVLDGIGAQTGCLLARMSGSGSSCFGIFENENSAKDASAKLAQENPDWWVKTAWLGRPERY